MARQPERIAWTQEHASAEFAINPRTLGARLKQSGAKPDEQGRWTTIQIATAVYGSLELERIRKTRAEAAGNEMANRVAAGELVDISDFVAAHAVAYVECVRIIRE